MLAFSIIKNFGSQLFCNFFHFRKLTATFLRSKTLSYRSTQGEQMQLPMIRIEILSKTELSRKRVRQKCIPYHMELSRKWSSKMKNPSCVEISRNWSGFFIYRWIFDFAINPHMLVPLKYSYTVDCKFSKSTQVICTNFAPW